MRYLYSGEREGILTPPLDRTTRIMLATTAVAGLLLALVSAATGSAVLASAAAVSSAIAATIAIAAARRGTRAPSRAQPTPTRAAAPVPRSTVSHGPAPRGPSDLPAGLVQPHRTIFTAPEGSEPPAVVHALLVSSEPAGTAVAAHLWLLDPATDTLRLVSADGSMPPPALPVSAQGTILGRALDEARDVYAPLTRMRDEGSADASMWRYAMPVTGGEARGVAAIDFKGDVEPDHLLLERISAQSHASLVGALALHVARQETAAARALLEAAQELSRLLDVDEIVRSLLRHAIELSGAATASVMLRDPESGNLEIIASEGLPSGVVSGTALSPGEGIAGWVLASGKPLVIEDLPGRATASRRHGVRTAVSVPIGDKDGVLGVLNVGCRVFAARFSAEHLKTLETLARMGAVALRNARAVRSTGDLYFDTLKALALALESKDPYAHGGTERVIACATAIGRELALDDREARALEIAALLHDIGMIASGEASARTDRPLTTIEWGLLKMHPVIAAEILEQAPALREVAPIVYHHHEHYDGAGYVNGLSGAEIPLGARILAVADAYVAMTSMRPYRQAMSHEAAVAELRANAGTQFDPHVVEALVDIAAERPDLVACWQS